MLSRLENEERADRDVLSANKEGEKRGWKYMMSMRRLSDASRREFGLIPKINDCVVEMVKWVGGGRVVVAVWWWGEMKDVGARMLMRP